MSDSTVRWMMLFTAEELVALWDATVSRRSQLKQFVQERRRNPADLACMERDLEVLSGLLSRVERERNAAHRAQLALDLQAKGIAVVTERQGCRVCGSVYHRADNKHCVYCNNVWTPKKLEGEGR